MEIAFVLGGLFLFCTIGFVAVALFVPELVGIQGKKAKEIEASQREDNSLKDEESNLPRDK
jgi:hypothetical protein